MIIPGMRPALLVTGNYSPLLRREGLKESVDQIKNVFHKFDIYYQTWNGELYEHIFKDIDEEIFTYDEPPPPPVSPYEHAFANNIITEGYHKRRVEEFIQKDMLYTSDRLINMCKQHYGFCLLYKDLLNKKYKKIIRTRWDIVLSKYFDPDYILHLSKTNIVGCGLSTSSTRFKSVYQNSPPLSKDETALRKKRRIAREILNENAYFLDEQSTAKKDNDHWTNFIIDFIISFNREDFDVDKTLKLYRENKLYPAEWGWHQMMCQKRKHINIDGFAALRRNLEDIGNKKYWVWK